MTLRICRKLFIQWFYTQTRIRLSNRLDKRPGYAFFEKYRWVDYFELLCISNIDKELDITTMIDRIYLKEKDGIDSGLGDSGELDIEEQNHLESDNELRFYEYYKHFELRVHQFGEFYPFLVEGKKIILKEDYDTDSKKLLYIYLICCSSLNYFRDFQDILTSDFEEISSKALTKMFPENITHVLGKSSVGGKRKYQGNVYSKLESMAEDLSARLRVTKKDFSINSSGDGGLDIISWFGFNDNLSSIPTFSCQCKCSSNWTSSSDPASLLSGYFDMDCNPFSIYFIPFSYRRASGNWHQIHHVRNKVLLDRMRICNLMDGQEDLFLTLGAKVKVDEFIQEKQNVI